MNEPTTTHTENPTCKRRILVVEDNQFTATLYKKVLEREGFEVVHIANGRSAFNAILDQRFDLVMLDLMLPEMDGLEILQRVHAEDQQFKTPVVVLSEVELGAVRQQVRDLGVKQFLSKTGADALKIVEAIKALASGAGAGDGQQAPHSPKVTHHIDPSVHDLDMIPAQPFEVRKINQVYPDDAVWDSSLSAGGARRHKHRGMKPLTASLRRFLFLC